MYLNCARNGGAFVFSWRAEDCAAALVNPKLNVFLTIAVIRRHQGHGLGTSITRYLQCNFARVIQEFVPFFERNGYTCVGDLKRGNRLYTQVMVKSALIPLAGRISKLYGDK